MSGHRNLLEQLDVEVMYGIFVRFFAHSIEEAPRLTITTGDWLCRDPTNNRDIFISLRVEQVDEWPSFWLPSFYSVLPQIRRGFIHVNHITSQFYLPAEHNDKFSLLLSPVGFRVLVSELVGDRPEADIVDLIELH